MNGDYFTVPEVHSKLYEHPKLECISPSCPLRRKNVKIDEEEDNLKFHTSLFKHEELLASQCGDFASGKLFQSWEQKESQIQSDN